MVCFSVFSDPCPVGWGCRIHRLLLCTHECHEYNTNLSDGEDPVMLNLWIMPGTPSLPSLPGPLLPEVVLSDSVLSMGQIGLYCIDAKLNCLRWENLDI